MIFAPYILLAFAGLLSLVSASPSRSHHRRGVGSKYLNDKRVISAFLTAHNDVRAAHGAADLTWSYTLAAKADIWASDCVWAHTNGVLLDTPYGENMVAAPGHLSIQAAVDAFTQDEFQYKPSKPTYNHWTQVVWKDTTEVGCAVSQCNNIFDDLATYYVCFYNPPGNVVGQALANVQI